jgi:predicted Rossmann-fold nucleotide-binding protein
VREEIGDLDELRAHRAAGGDLRGAVVIGLDLSAEDELLRAPLDGALLLGCVLSPAAQRRADAAGALLFPVIPDLPYDVYRSHLYTPAELFAGFDPRRPESYADTPDARIYRHTQQQGRHPDPLHALAERLHDHAITEALDEVLTGLPVAVMGGHALARDSAGYRAAVELGAALGRAGFTVLTGGGPGAMEAVPLGVRLGPDAVEVLPALAAAPRFGEHTTSIGQWLAAFPSDLPSGDVPRTIGIPTWFYGHEPPNPACELHAKYFANSVREEGLLTVATGGIVYTPGSAGTVQEVFQDYAQNHYGSVGRAAPMVFLGKDFWVNEVPAATLVQQLARGREAERWILVTDDAAEAVALLQDYAGTPR